MRIQLRLSSAVVATIPILALTMLSGCATKPVPRPSDQDQISVWLVEAPRTLQLDVKADLPEGRIRTRDEQMAKKVLMVPGGALAGVGTVLYYGCGAGGLFGCIIGVVISPVAAVVGAVAGPQSVKPIDTFHPPTEVSGAVEMLGELHSKRIDLPALLAARFRLLAAKSGKHTLVGAGMLDEGTLVASLDELALSADIGEPTKFGLVLTMRVEAQVKSGENIRLFDSWRNLKYEGTKQAPVSEWMRDDAKRLREETVAALDALATQFFSTIEKTGKDPGTRATVQRWWSTRP